VVAEVTALALEYRLMSPYTSFVAVDEGERVNPDGEPRRVDQALPLPEGVSFEGVFGPQGPPCLRPAPDRPEPIDEDGGRTSTFHDEFVDDLPVVGHGYQGASATSVASRNGEGDARRGARGARQRAFEASVAGVRNVEPTSVAGAETELVERVAVAAAPSSAGSDRGGATGGATRVYARKRSFSSELAETARPSERDRDERLRDRALRVLADLAEDGELSPAEGRPALAALLGALAPEGALSRDVTVQALGTWALAEAAAALPEDPWLPQAVERAASFLAGLALETGWPERRGGEADAEATRWARLALEAADAGDAPSLEAPRGAGSAAWAGLRRALASARSGAPAEAVEGGDPFARLLRAVPRGYLTLCDRAAPDEGA
jgi:hypothetical protein